MDAERDERGRFVRGWRGGPGRPPRAVEEQYLAALREALSLDDWRAIVARAVEQAKRGDATARQFLAHYAMGKPVERADIDVSASGDRLALLLAEVRDTLPGDGEPAGGG